MTQVIMLLLFPIGFYFYFFVERKSMPTYQKVFDDFQVSILKETHLNDAEKLEQFTHMLQQNDYTIVEHTKSTVKGEKHIFYMSLLAMGLGIYFVGALIYLIYYFLIQKPHVVEYKV